MLPRILMLIGLMSACPALADAKPSKELIYGRWGTFCPYNCNFDESQHYGLITDIFMAVAKANNLTFRQVFIPEKRKYIDLEKGKSTVVTLWSGSADTIRDQLVVAKEAIAMIYFATITRKESEFVFSKLADLEAINLGVEASSDLPLELTKYIERNRGTSKVNEFFGVGLWKRSFLALQSNRIDAFIYAEGAAIYQVKALGFSDTLRVVRAPYFAPVYLYPAFSRKNPYAQELADMMDKGIRDLTNSGEIKKIHQSYGLK